MAFWAGTENKIFNTGSSQQPIVELRLQKNALEYLWQQGISGRSLLEKHTGMIDAYLEKNFYRCPESKKGFALLALGGYGRGDLFPYSDIDLMLLYAPEVENKTEKVAEAVFYPLWDAGLEVGHGVRTSVECLADAEEDFFFRVALLDARLIAGSEALFNYLKEAFQISFIEGRRREFLQTMVEHRQSRHQQFGQHSYMLEPNIKESRGGLRDLQAMLWTAQVVFGLDDTQALREAGLLIEGEQQKLDRAGDYLIKIRNRLHYISGRKNDQLFFEHQEEMAEAFAYKSDKDMLGVELFMGDVYANLHTVAIATDLFFEHVDEVLGLASPTVQDRPLEAGIEIQGGRIKLIDSDPATNISGFMRVFVQAAKTGVPVHYRTRRFINSHLHLIDDKARRSQRLARSFFEILQKAPLSVLEAMLETGLFSSYLPELSEIVSLVQHDVYHMYTVDIHSLHTVVELQKLEQEMPHIFQEFEETHSVNILYLAGLIHDIGKGQGSGHAESGAEKAAVIGERLGLEQAEVDLLVWLVRNHLFLYHNAMRRDMEDETFLFNCAEQVNSAGHLAMLYLLSIADSRATGPNAWNDWKAALFLELYLKVVNLLNNKGLGDPERGQGAAWMRARVLELMEDNCEIDIQALPEDYLIGFTPEEIVEQIKHRRQFSGQDVVVQPKEQSGFWSILVMTMDQSGLLAKICGVLALHNLQILSAQIFTWPDGTVVDAIDVCPIVDKGYEDQDWKALQVDMQKAINRQMGLDHRISSKSPVGSAGQVPALSRRPAQVIIDNETSERFTVFEVYAKERIGLLYDITRVMTDFGINIFQARIGSRSDQAVDVFYVRDSNDKKITDNKLQEEIREGLLHAVTVR